MRQFVNDLLSHEVNGNCHGNVYDIDCERGNDEGSPYLWNGESAVLLKLFVKRGSYVLEKNDFLAGKSADGNLEN